MATGRALEAHAETHGPHGPLSRSVTAYQASRIYRGHALTAAFDPIRTSDPIDFSSENPIESLALRSLKAVAHMAEERVQRRLAAILAADVVGYSRLMEREEAATLAGLKARRKEVLEPLVTRHQGRIFKVTKLVT